MASKDPTPSQICALALKESNLASKERTLQLKHISKKTVKLSISSIIGMIDVVDRRDIESAWDCTKSFNSALSDTELNRLLGIIAMKKSVRTRFDEVTLLCTLLNDSITEQELQAIKDKCAETFKCVEAFSKTAESEDNAMRDNIDIDPISTGKKRGRQEAGLEPRGELDSNSDEDDDPNRYDNFDANTKAIFMKLDAESKKTSKRIKKSSSASITKIQGIQEQLTQFQNTNQKANDDIKKDLVSLTEKHESIKKQTEEKFTSIDAEIKNIKQKLSPIEEIEYMEYRHRIVEAEQEVRANKNKLELLATTDIIKSELIDTTQPSENEKFSLSDQKVKTFIENKLDVKIRGTLKASKTFKVNNFKHGSNLTFSVIDTTNEILEKRAKFKSQENNDSKKNASIGRILPKSLKVGYGKLKQAKKDGLIDDVVLTKGGVICVIIADKRKTVHDRFEMLFIAKEKISAESFQDLIDRKKYVNSKLELKDC